MPLPNDDSRDPVDQLRLIKALEEQSRERVMDADGEVTLDAVAAGESHQVMADELGVTRAAVKHRLTRMRDALADRVENEGMSHLRREKGRRPLAKTGGHFLSFTPDFAGVGRE